jgi:hypothetical protein
LRGDGVVDSPQHGRHIDTVNGDPEHVIDFTREMVTLDEMDVGFYLSCPLVSRHQNTFAVYL